MSVCKRKIMPAAEEAQVCRLLLFHVYNCVGQTGGTQQTIYHKTEAPTRRNRELLAGEDGGSCQRCFPLCFKHLHCFDLYRHALIACLLEWFGVLVVKVGFGFDFGFEVVSCSPGSPQNH